MIRWQLKIKNIKQVLQISLWTLCKCEKMYVDIYLLSKGDILLDFMYPNLT